MSDSQIEKNKRLLLLKGYEEEDDVEPVQHDLERGNRALVLYERKKRDEELDRLEKYALQLLIKKLEET